MSLWNWSDNGIFSLIFLSFGNEKFAKEFCLLVPWDFFFLWFLFGWLVAYVKGMVLCCLLEEFWLWFPLLFLFGLGVLSLRLLESFWLLGLLFLSLLLGLPLLLSGPLLSLDEEELSSLSSSWFRLLESFASCELSWSWPDCKVISNGSDCLLPHLFPTSSLLS